MPPPKIGGKDFGPNNVKLKVFGIRATDVVPPNVWFGVLCLIFVVLLALVVVNVRRSGTGRRFLAVRGNERAAAAAGVSVAGTKCWPSGSPRSSPGSAAAVGLPLRVGDAAVLRRPQSLLFLAFAYLGGISSVMGAILGRHAGAERRHVHRVREVVQPRPELRARSSAASG